MRCFSYCFNEAGEKMAEEEVGSLAVSVSLTTTEFNKGIASMNKQMQIAGQEFKNASGGLDAVGDASKISALKIEELTKKIDLQQGIVDQLSQAHQRAAEKFGEGSKQALDYGLKLKRAEGALQSMRGQLTTTSQQLEIQSSRWTALGNAMQSASEKLKSVGEGMAKVGQGLSVGVTAPILAAGGAMLKGAIDAETAQGKLQASLGITAEEADKLGRIAQEVWKDAFGESIEEASEAVSTVRKNMSGLADEELKSVAEGAMTIADVFGAEVVDSTKAAGTMMENFGISGQDALDIITVGFQNGGDYSGELLDTLNEYSPQFASMGLTADQAMGILVAGANAGSFSLDKVGDAMKEFNIRAQDGSKATSDGFTAIGLNAEQMGAAIAKGGEDGQKAFTATVAALAAMKDPMAQNTAGTALFGTQWEDVRAKVIVAMADGVKGIGDFKGATDTAAKAMYDNNPGAALTSSMRQLQAAIGPTLLPLASIITNDIVPAFKALADGFNNLSPVGQKTALAITGIAAAIGPLLLVISTVVSAIGTISGAFASVSAAIAAAGGAMAVLTGPIGIAIALIATFAAGAYLIYNNWEPIKEFLGNLWTSITTSATIAWEGIKEFFSNSWEAIGQDITSSWNGIKEFFSSLWQEITTTTKEVWNSIEIFFIDIWDAIKTGVTAIATLLIDGILELWDSMKDGVTKVMNGLKLFLTGIWEVMKNVILGTVLLLIDLVTLDFNNLSTDSRNIFNNLKNAFGQIWEGIKLIFTGAVQAISGFLKAEWEGIKTVAETVWNGLRTFFENLWTEIKTAATNAWNTLKTSVIDLNKNTANGVKELWDGLLAWLRELPSKLKTIGSDMFTSMKEGINATINTAVEAIKTGVGLAITWLKNLPSEAITWGYDFITGFKDGIMDAMNDLLDAVESIADQIRGYLHFSTPDRGPLADYETWMPDFMSGLAQGIQKNKYLVTDAISGLSSDMNVGVRLNSISGATSSGYAQAGSFSQPITVVNQGTIVGSNGMKEFAKTVSTEIARTTGLAVGGGW